MDTTAQTSPVPAQPIYQPVGVPAVAAPKQRGLTLAIVGIVCAIVSLLFLPPIFGIAGIVLGIIATHKGEKALGITALVMSAVFMILGMLFGYYVGTHPDLLKSQSSVNGAIIESLL